MSRTSDRGLPLPRQSWTDNADNETSCKLARKTGLAGTWGTIATLAANTTSYANTGLSSGTTYDYRLRACPSGEALSPYSNEANATTP